MVTAAPRTLRGVGLEVTSSPGRTALRARVPVVPVVNDGPFLSDILFYQPGDDPPRDLDAAVSRMVGTTSFPSGSSIGVFWESTAATGDSIAVEVRVTKVASGVGKVLSSLFRRHSTSSAVGWTVAVAGAEPVGHATDIDLSHLRPGLYTVQITFESRGWKRSTQRTFEIVPAEPRGE
jgi:hypothetical protein